MKNAKTLTAAGGKTISKKLTRLTAGKKYYVQVRAYKKSGSKKVYGSWSVKKSFTTYPLKTVKIFSITEMPTAAIVRWDNVERAKGYEIRYSAASNMAKAKVLTVTDYPYKRITNLAPGQKYYVQVRAYKKSGSKKVYGPWSAKKSFTTQYKIKYVDNLDQYKISCSLQYTGSENPTSYTAADSITLENPICVSNFNGYRTLYLFDGWYSDKACTQRVTKIAKGTKGNLTFYAKWKPVSFKVNYQLNDSADAPAKAVNNPSTYYYGENYALKAPSREGYVFLGWYIKPYTTRVIENFNDTSAYEDLTLCASWRPVGKGVISYNVNFKAAWELTIKNVDTSASSDYPRYEEAATSDGSYPIKYYYLLNEGSGTGYSGEALLQPTLPNANFVGWQVDSCSTSDFTYGQIIKAIPKGFSGNLYLRAMYSDPGLEACRESILNDTTLNDLEKVKAWANQLTHGYYTYGSYRDLSLEEYTELSNKYISKYGFFNHGTCLSGADDIKEFCDDLGLRCVLRFAGNDTVPGKTYNNTDHRNTYVWYEGKRYCIGATPGGGSEQFEVTKDLIQYLPDYYDYKD